MKRRGFVLIAGWGIAVTLSLILVGPAAGQVLTIPFGAPGDVPVVGRWTGDRTSYIGVFRPSIQTFILSIGNFIGAPVFTVGPFGASSDIPVVGHWCDVGINNRAEKPALYRPSTSTFFIRCVNEGTITAIPFGAAGDIPLANNFNLTPGTGIGLYRPSTNTFLLRNTLTPGGPDSTITFGAPGDTPLIAYSFDLGTNFASQSAALAVYRPSERNFYNVAAGPINFGASGDIPLVGDWTGTGSFKVGVYRPSTNTFILKTTNP
jgi:hypothetical protein